MRVREVTEAGVNELAAADVVSSVAAGRGLVWVDLEHTDERGMALLPRLFDVRAVDVRARTWWSRCSARPASR